MLHASASAARAAAGAASAPATTAAAAAPRRPIVASKRAGPAPPAASAAPASAPPQPVFGGGGGGAAPATRPGQARSCADRVRLGRSDLLASAITLGTMTWGKQNTEAEAHEQLSYAIDERGLNALDTAEIYPVPPAAETKFLTDKYIGSWLKKRGKRDDLLIFTKVAGYGDRTAWVRDPPETTMLDRRQIVSSVDASLARLGVDTIDLLQAHWPQRYVGGLFGAPSYDIALERPDDGGVSFEETLRGFEEVVKAGKVRYIGVSNETSYGVASYARLADEHGLPRIQTIQNVYSLLQRGGFETDLAEMCRRADVSLLAYSPLAGGSLSNKYATSTAEELRGARFNLFEGYMKRYNDSLAREAVAEYARVAREAGITPAALALGWVRSRWFVASNIIGATSMAQLKENLDAYDAPPLGDDVIAAIGAVYKKYRDPPTSP
jgi:aryl-alcohol dehydrogenase-like predicted oxidoreductase